VPHSKTPFCGVRLAPPVDLANHLRGLIGFFLEDAYSATSAVAVSEIHRPRITISMEDKVAAATGTNRSQAAGRL